MCAPSTTLDARSGTIRTAVASDGALSFYPPGLGCTWTIAPPLGPGEAVRLTFEAFGVAARANCESPQAVLRPSFCLLTLCPR